MWRLRTYIAPKERLHFWTRSAARNGESPARKNMTDRPRTDRFRDFYGSRTTNPPDERFHRENYRLVLRARIALIARPRGTMSSTDGVATEDEHLLSDPEKRAERAHTGHSVARFLASVVTFAVCFVLALHFLVGPDITAVSRAAEPAEAAAETSRREARREAESLLSSIERVASREERGPVVAARVAPDPASLGKKAIDSDADAEVARAEKRTTPKDARPETSKAKPSSIHSNARLDAPVYLVSAPGDDADAAEARADEIVARLTRAFGEDAVVKHARVLAGVDATRWPGSELRETVYALKSVFALLGGDHRRPDFRLVRDLPWVGAVAARDADSGKLAPPWTHDAVAAPLGSLFSHMRAWQSAADAGAKRAFFVENGATTGLRPSHLDVPLAALGAIAERAPEDADVVILNQPLFGDDGADVSARFADADGNAIEIRPWRQRGVAGATAYMFTDTFVAKVFAHVAKHGADAPDAWLLDSMCAADSADETGAFAGFDARGAAAPALRCYKASGVRRSVKRPERLGDDAGEERLDARKDRSVGAVGAETAALRRRMGIRAAKKKTSAGDARAEAAREARAYVAARTAEAAETRAYVEKAHIRTTEDTL